MSNETTIDELRNQMQPALPAQSQATALVSIAQEREIAEVQGAMTIAKRFPRDQRLAIDRITNACSRPGLAEAAQYEYARGGTSITGPTIRMAEVLAQSWGNIQSGVREIEQRDGVSTVEAYAWDLETNARDSKVFQVIHEIGLKGGGKKKLTDQRDIYEHVANQGARRKRACILAIIPGDIVDVAMRQCEITLKTKAEVTPERIKSLLEKFGEYGVTAQQIEKRIQRRIDSMTPALLLGLGRIFNSLKEGMSKPADWFEPLTVAESIASNRPASAATTAPKKEPAAAKQKAADKKPAEEEPAAAAVATAAPATKPDATAVLSTKTEEETDNLDGWVEMVVSSVNPSELTFEVIEELIADAQTIEDLNAWGARLKTYKHITATEVNKLGAVAKKRAGELKAAAAAV
jgi:hypothetical protein